MEWVVAVIVVEARLVEMVGEWLSLFLGVGVEAEVEKVRILLFASKKSRSFLQISSQEPWMSFWEREE